MKPPFAALPPAARLTRIEPIGLNFRLTGSDNLRTIQQFWGPRMIAMTEPSNDASHFHQLLGYLDYDPDNLQLMADAASAAVDEGDSAAASGLIDRYAAQAPLPPAMLNLKGIIAMSEGRFEEAASGCARAPLQSCLGADLGEGL
jgi:hypothetical protein